MRSEREANHSPPNNSKANNGSCHYFHSPYMLLCSGQGKVLLSAPHVSWFSSNYSFTMAES